MFLQDQRPANRQTDKQTGQYTARRAAVSLRKGKGIAPRRENLTYKALTPLRCGSHSFTTPAFTA